jgi:hypothetical protein
MAQAFCWIVAVIVVAIILYAINRRYRWMLENGFAEETRPCGGGPFFVWRESRAFGSNEVILIIRT